MTNEIESATIEIKNIDAMIKELMEKKREKKRVLGEVKRRYYASYEYKRPYLKAYSKRNRLNI